MLVSILRRLGLLLSVAAVLGGLLLLRQRQLQAETHEPQGPGQAAELRCSAETLVPGSGCC